MTTLRAVRPVLPKHVYPQEQLSDEFARLCLEDPKKHPIMKRLHGSARVETRHLALPIEDYAELDGFTDANTVFIDKAVELGSEAVLGALEDAGLTPRDVDIIVSTTVTGIAVPSLEARIAARIGLRADVKRVPMLGLGCLAGAAGIARIHDMLRGGPDDVAVLISVELCSLTVQRNNPTAANMVASGLFGDGAAAVVAVGGETASGPRVVDTVSHLYPDTERAMGWDVGASGFEVVLGAEVPGLVQQYLRDDIVGFLEPHGLTIGDIDRWISHPGGPKVIEAIQDALGLDESDLAMTCNSLRRIGNLSSSSVLHVLADTLRERPCEPGDWGVLMAMGPGFCAELVLLRW